MQDSSEDSLADDENIVEVHIAGAELGSAVAEALGPAAATYITLDFFQHDTQATPPGHGLRRARAVRACPSMHISAAPYTSGHQPG